MDLEADQRPINTISPAAPSDDAALNGTAQLETKSSISRERAIVEAHQKNLADCRREGVPAVNDTALYRTAKQFDVTVIERLEAILASEGAEGEIVPNFENTKLPVAHTPVVFPSPAEEVIEKPVEEEPVEEETAAETTEEITGETAEEKTEDETLYVQGGERRQRLIDAFAKYGAGPIPATPTNGTTAEHITPPIAPAECKPRRVRTGSNGVGGTRTEFFPELDLLPEQQPAKPAQPTRKKPISFPYQHGMTNGFGRLPDSYPMGPVMRDPDFAALDLKGRVVSHMQSVEQAIHLAELVLYLEDGALREFHKGEHHGDAAVKFLFHLFKDDDAFITSLRQIGVLKPDNFDVTEEFIKRYEAGSELGNWSKLMFNRFEIIRWIKVGKDNRPRVVSIRALTADPPQRPEPAGQAVAPAPAAVLA